MIDTEILNS